MRAALFPVPLLTLAGPAAAHPGHLAAGLAGHDHWVAGAAIGAAIALGAWAAWKGRKRPEAEPEAEPEDEAEAAA